MGDDTITLDTKGDEWRYSGHMVPFTDTPDRFVTYTGLVVRELRTAGIQASDSLSFEL